MLAPFLGKLFHFIVIGKRAQFVKNLETLPNTEVASGENVESTERENEEHVCGPRSDAFYLRERRDYLFRRHRLERSVLYGAVGEFLCEVFEVDDFLGGETRGAHARRGHFKNLFGCREFSCRWFFPIYRSIESDSE